MVRPWVFAALLVGLPSAAFELRKDASGALVRWREGVDFVVDESLPAVLSAPGAADAVRSAVDTVAAVAKSIHVTAHVGPVGAFGYDTKAPEKNQSQIVALDEWPYDDSALAVTLLTLNGRTHELLDADIAFNAQHYAFRVLGTEDQAQGSDARRELLNDVQNTLTHELGHALGLLHNETDSLVVMYPGAAPFETHKRTLAADDRLGLGALYDGAFGSAREGASELPTPTLVPGAGCSVAPAAPPAMVASLAALLAMCVLAAKRTRVRVAVRAGAVLALVEAAAAVAGPPPLPSAEVDLSLASSVSVGRVRGASVAWSRSNAGLLVTELTIELQRCLRGECDATVFVTVPGGRLGDLEQIVAHYPLPEVGSAIATYTVAGRRRVRLLDSPADRERFELALRRAELSWVGSNSPQGGQGNPQLLPQTPVSRH